MSVAEADAQARAEDLALEQTVEVPSSAIRDAFVAEHIRGRVENVVADSEGGHLARIAYPVAATHCDPAQLVNVIFGNSSLHADTECVDVSFPTELCSALQGPRFGISGLRKTFGQFIASKNNSSATRNPSSCVFPS